MNVKKEELVEKIKNRIKEDISIIKKLYEITKKEALEAPGAMQSASDTTRSQNSHKIEVILERLENLEKSYQYLELLSLQEKKDNVSIGSLIELELAGGNYYLFVLPGGEGDEFCKDGEEKIIVVSPDAPLLKGMLEKKIGEEINFRGKKIKIKSIA